jgi:hypothetical protein
MNPKFPVAVALFLSLAAPMGKAQSRQQGQPVGLSRDDRVNELQKQMGEAADRGDIVGYNRKKHEAEKILAAPDPDPVPSQPLKKVPDSPRKDTSSVQSTGTGCKTQQVVSGQGKSCEDLFKPPRRMDGLPPAGAAGNYVAPTGSSVTNGGGKK